MSTLPWPGWPREQKVWVQEVDPDLPEGSALADLVRTAAASVENNGRRLAASGMPNYTLRAVVHCIGSDCHRAGLAYIWRTEQHGLLYWATLVYAHDHDPPPPGVLMVHPDLPGPGGVIEVSAGAVPAHERSGWIIAPRGTPRRRREYREPMFAVDVRDLLDVESADHPPLRAKCRRHRREVTLDRELLRAELAAAPDTRKPYRIPLNAVLVL